MVDARINLNIVGALSRANAAANSLITPATSRFFREILEKALTNPVGVAPRWAAEAWALLANILVNDVLQSWNYAGMVELNAAEDAVQNALAMDSNLVLAHHAKGLVFRARGDHRAALRAFERAVVLDGSFARAHAQRANELTLLGQPANALRSVQAAIDLSPNDSALGTFLWIQGRAYFVSAQADATLYDAAIQSLEQAVQLWPTVWFTWAYLISALTRRDVNRARMVLAQFLEQPHFQGLTLEDVNRYEKANPDDNELIVRARQAMREGLRTAGMEER
jgi:tetratricopeptide (TPR) repeat protein